MTEKPEPITLSARDSLQVTSDLAHPTPAGERLMRAWNALKEFEDRGGRVRDDDLVAEGLRTILEGAGIPRVSLSDVERRAQAVYGLRGGEPAEAVLEALRQASEDVFDLLACLRGHYEAVP